MKAVLAGAALVFTTAALPVASEATTIGFCSGQLEGLGQCTKTVTYDSATNILLVTLTNTSPAGNGGFLTADAFNLGAPASPDIQVVSFTGDAAFPAFTINPAAPSGGGSISVEPFGTREFVISATGGDWLGGGSPNGGIPVGASATFRLTLSADITEASLFGSNEAIRFRGFENEGSDKTFATVSVPEPGTALLLTITGLVGIVTYRRKRLVGQHER